MGTFAQAHGIGEVCRLLQYDFDPKKLLGRILHIFVNLWQAPGGKDFAAAVAEDGRSYRPENFTEAAEIAGKVELPGFHPSLVPNLEALAAGVIQASEDVQADDEVRRCCCSPLATLVDPRFSHGMYQLPALGESCRGVWRFTEEVCELHGLICISMSADVYMLAAARQRIHSVSFRVRQSTPEQCQLVNVVQLIMEAPDEFLDPITSALMRDPVIMPASRQSIDRPTILRHLMTDPRDPISRAPLAPEQLLEAPELKASIDSWIAERRAQRPSK